MFEPTISIAGIDMSIVGLKYPHIVKEGGDHAGLPTWVVVELLPTAKRPVATVYGPFVNLNKAKAFCRNKRTAAAGDDIRRYSVNKVTTP